MGTAVSCSCKQRENEYSIQRILLRRYWRNPQHSTNPKMTGTTNDIESFVASGASSTRIASNRHGLALFIAIAK
jgi:hypothetical protein